MSKSITRVLVAVLISLGILAASTPSVQARLGGILQKAGSNNAAYISQTPKEASVGGRPRYFQTDSFEKDSASHECGSDPSLDY
jgi:hypothetical protein